VEAVESLAELARVTVGGTQGIEGYGLGLREPDRAPDRKGVAADLRLLGAGQRVRVLFKGEGADGFSLVHARFAPGYRLPRHSHSADCLYYVVSGEAHMGSRVLKPGDGFFILAEAPYAYTAGPEGVEVLEFRHATTFDIKIRDKTLEHWKPVIEAIKAHGESWAPAPVGAP
jgi:quercetin dioxygenase-like cupin family protein